MARLQSRQSHRGTQVHPADLDDSIRVSAVASSDAKQETRLPFAVDSTLMQGASSKLWAVRRSPCEPYTRHGMLSMHMI